ncbi:cache domain-containing protein [Arthrobacter sp. GCM10027362]|uniref:cache domain-containing protein n=1 Tax=Arthrobacter sp. GCM10027362 TaxID=3273379 RepID=UPI0036391E75
MKSLEEVLHSTAEALGQHLERVFADLAVLAEETTRILTDSGTSRSMLESLKPVVQGIVMEQGGLVDSAGVSVTPGLLKDAETWHQWWSYIGGQLVFIPHNLNPASVNYYDYTEMTWFERPLASGRPELTGPYIDFGGAFDMKVVTASRPVLHGARTAAVAGADLSMDFIERAFLRNLGRRNEHVALITETGKVVASNSARFAPGTRFEGPRTGLDSVPVPVAALAAPPWHLIVAG